MKEVEYIRVIHRVEKKEVINMIRYLALDSTFVEAFMVQKLAIRLAGMLSSILVSLSGPRGLDIKVTNPEKYNFEPKMMIIKQCMCSRNSKSFHENPHPCKFYSINQVPL